MKKIYNKYSEYLKNKYGEKVYKLPLNIPVTCPNREEGNGCTFCGEKGAGHESLSNALSIEQQLSKNKDYISRRYKAHKFIAYLQNYTNTYMKLDRFKDIIGQCAKDDIVEIAIATRPDCINDKYLEFLYEFSNKTGINITIELGLQTANYHTLKKINRGHGLAEFVDAVLRINRYGFDICTHVILNLPWDDITDTIETAKLLSVLQIKFIKLHSLYIVNNTEMAKQYIDNEFELIDKDKYVERVITFLEYLNDTAVIQRLIARAPAEETVFANWNTSWWKIRDQIEETMSIRNTYQGIKNNYMNGSALRKFD